MATYRNAEFGFSIQYPTDWEQDSRVGTQEGRSVRFASDDGDSLEILIEDLVAAGFGDFTLDDYAKAVISVIESDDFGTRVASSSRYGEMEGEPAQLLLTAPPSGAARGVRLILISDTKVAYNAKYVTFASQLEDLIPIIEYSFRSITVHGKPLTDAPEFPG